RLLPERHPKSLPPDLSRHARTLVDQYQLARAGSAVATDPGDSVLVSAPAAGDTHLDMAAALLTPTTGIAAIIRPPRSPHLGETALPGMVTTRGDVVVLAIQRQGEDLGPGEVTLRPGDTLLLNGPWASIESHAGDNRVLAVDSPDLIRRQAVPLGPGAARAIA